MRDHIFTYLRVYDTESFDNLRNIELEGFFSQLLVPDSKGALLYSPVEEDYIFMVSMQ